MVPLLTQNILTKAVAQHLWIMVTERKMEIIEISQCKKNLDFRPNTPWPKSKTPIAWQGELFCAFDSTEGQVINFSPQDLFLRNEKSPVHLFKDCHPKLNLVEISKLEKTLVNFSGFSFDEILKAYNLRADADLKELIRILQELPSDVLNVFAKKDISPRELSPIRILFLKKERAHSNISLFWNFLGSVEASKQILVRCIEYAIDLYLMGRSWDEILIPNPNGEDWLRHLMVFRFPETSKKDRACEKLLYDIPWPRDIRPTWVRKGDLSSLEIKLNSLSYDDLRTKTKILYELVERNATLEELWKSL